MAAKKQTQKPPETTQEATPDNNTGKSPMLQKGGLWLNRTKDNELYFSGYDGNLKLLIFKNKFKENDSHPDYVMYVTEKPRPQAASANDLEQEHDTDDIPF